jgi:hypothetical protein
VAQHPLDGVAVVAHEPRGTVDLLERALHLERQVGSRLVRHLELVATRADHARVALADPVLLVRAREVRRCAPDQRDVLVEDPRVHARARARRRHVADEEAQVLVLAGVREVVGGVEEVDPEARQVAELEQPGGARRERPVAVQRRTARDARGELASDAARCQRRGNRARDDALRDRGRQGRPADAARHRHRGAILLRRLRSAAEKFGLSCAASQEVRMQRIAVALLLAVVACSRGEESTPAAPPTEGATPTPVPTAAATTASGPGGKPPVIPPNATLQFEVDLQAVQ